MAPKLLSHFFVAFFLLFSQSAVAYNVVSFGARGNGKTDSTLGFLRAWRAACASRTPSEVYIPRGSYVVKPVSFDGPCKTKITFRNDGTLVAPGILIPWGILDFGSMSYLSVIGGTLDARGSVFWQCRRKGYNCPAGARSVTFMWCNNVNVRGLKSYNSQTIHIAISHSNNIKMSSLYIRAPSGSPNTDGINILQSRGVTITGSTIQTGDDCVTVGQGSMNVWIANIGCGPGHGISRSLGDSYNEAGVQNVTVTSSVFTKTQNGVRVKSWAKPSTGYAKNLNFRNLIMKSVGYPIIIDQKYCPDNRCPHQSSGVKVSQVTYDNIKGTSATQAAMKFECSSSKPCTGIKLRNIKLTYVNTRRLPTLAYCKYASGSRSGTVSPRSCL
ncbi:hypothetical protein Leryth_001753 [Lithospermum erythrorhizon]|nr:hypothetical protein Leryth_001753 [Lithospermum erythrorhizon]